MSGTKETLTRTYNNAQLQQFLLDNLPSVIKYFQKFVTNQTSMEPQESWAAKKSRYDALDRQLKRIEQDYDTLLFADNFDIKPVRGDDAETTTYTEQYNILLGQKKNLQPQIRVGLLEQLLQQQLKVDEAQEAADWSKNPAYICATRYDNDSDNEENNERVLRQRQRDLKVLCDKVLADEEMRAYIAMRVTEQINAQSKNSATQHTY